MICSHALHLDQSITFCFDLSYKINDTAAKVESTKICPKCSGKEVLACVPCKGTGIDRGMFLSSLLLTLDTNQSCPDRVAIQQQSITTTINQSMDHCWSDGAARNAKDSVCYHVHVVASRD